MPTYVYRKPNGETVELVMRIAEMEERERPDGTIMIDGEECKRDFSRQRQGLGGLDSTPGWPIASEGLGVHPAQIPEMEKFYRDHGVPTQHTPDGRPLMRNRAHRRQVCEARGVIDRNGGYGDKT